MLWKGLGFLTNPVLRDQSGVVHGASGQEDHENTLLPFSHLHGHSVHDARLVPQNHNTQTLHGTAIYAYIDP